MDRLLLPGSIPGLLVRGCSVNVAHAFEAVVLDADPTDPDDILVITGPPWSTGYTGHVPYPWPASKVFLDLRAEGSCDIACRWLRPRFPMLHYGVNTPTFTYYYPGWALRGRRINEEVLFVENAAGFAGNVAAIPGLTPYKHNCAEAELQEATLQALYRVVLELARKEGWKPEGEVDRG